MKAEVIALLIMTLVWVVTFIKLFTEMNKKVAIQKKLSRVEERHVQLLRDYSKLKDMAKFDIQDDDRPSRILLELKKSYIKDPTQDHLISIMARIQQFKQIADQTNAERDKSRLESYCDSLEKNKIVKFYGRKD